MESTGCAGVVLAAGGSERWGGRPKALLPVGREVAVARVVRVSRDAGVDPIVVVAGESAQAISEAVASYGCEVVHHTDWRSGRTGSVQAGLARLPPKVDVLMWPVDHPLVEGATLAELHRVSTQDPMGYWFIPEYHGRRGHPVRWRAAVTPDVTVLAPSAPLRSLLPGLGPRVRIVPVSDPGVTENVDTPEAYRTALARFAASGGAR